MYYPPTADLKVIKTNEEDKLAMNAETCSILSEGTRRPKIARNIYEVRNIIKLRKKFKQIAKGGKHLYKMNIPDTDNCVNGNEKKDTVLKNDNLTNSKEVATLEKQKDIETYPSSVSESSDALAHTTVRINESTQENNPPKKSVNHAILLSDCVTVHSATASAKIKNNSCKSIRKVVIDKFKNASSRPCNNNIINCAQDSQVVETKSIGSTNKSFNSTEKLPIQSNIIDSAHSGGEIMKTVTLETRTNKGVPCDTSGLCKSVKRKKLSSQQSSHTVKTSPVIKQKVKKPKYEQNTKSKSTGCSFIETTENLKNSIREQANSTTLNDNSYSPFLDDSLHSNLLKVCKPLRTYMMNVHKPIRTYTRRRLDKIGINETVNSSFASDNESKASSEKFEASEANASKKTNLNDIFKPLVTDSSQVKVVNGLPSADERILEISADTPKPNPSVTEGNQVGTVDYNVNLCKLNISDGDLKITDGKLKISLNTNITSDMLNSSNIACLQFPRKIVLKIMKPTTDGEIENGDIQLISVNNVKLVVNTNTCVINNCTTSRVGVNGTVTTEDDGDSGKITSVASQTEDSLTQGVSDSHLVTQQITSNQEDAVTRNVTELCLVQQQESSEISQFSQTVNGQKDKSTEVIEPCLSSHLVNRQTSKDSQKNIICPTAGVEPIILSNQPSCSKFAEQSQQSEVSSKENNTEKINNFHTSDVQTITVSKYFYATNCMNEKNNNENPLMFCNSIKSNFFKILGGDAGEVLKDCVDRKKQSKVITLGDTEKNRETCEAKETDSQRQDKCKRQIKDNWTVQCNKSNLSSDLVSHMKFELAPVWSHSLENCPSPHIECVKRKKHYCGSQSCIKKSKKHKHERLHKNKSYIRNKDKLSLRNRYHLNKLQNLEQGERNRQHDKDVELTDEIDVGVKLCILPDGTPKIIKPRFAKNILEVRKIIKMEKKLQFEIDQMRKNKQCFPNIAHKKHVNMYKLADLFTSPFDTSKYTVPDFLLPSVRVQRLDLNPLTRKASSYHNKHNKIQNKTGIVMSGEENYNIDRSDVNLSFNDSSKGVIELCNPSFSKHEFEHVIDFQQTDPKGLSSFDEQISQPLTTENILVSENPFDGCVLQPVIVEEIPQVEQSFPYSCMTNWDL